VPALQEPEAIAIHDVIKEDDEIIAGMCADIYTWKEMYLELLFVDKTYRNKGLATMLLDRIEDEAKAMGVTLVHTDTDDFQGKDFYLKQGYETFGVSDECQRSDQRNYIKKSL